MSLSLEEALVEGRGVERPFRCPEHDDHNASASVNVVKGLWICYACGASGTVDGKKAPSVKDLQQMLAPEESVRLYPERWLELFEGGDYWATRFPSWVVAHARLGEDPLSGDATFPVRTPEGRLAGVGRRKADPGDGPRYVYPPRWSASRALFGYPERLTSPSVRTGVLALVEGAADACGVLEVGAVGLGCYGAGVHAPQREMISRLKPKVILAAFDMDKAGDAAAERAERDLADIAPVQRVTWPKKDPADTPLPARRQALVEAVGASGYGDPEVTLREWDAAARRLEEIYTQGTVKEAA